MSSFLTIAEPLAKLGIPMTPVRSGTKRAFLPDFPTTATTDLAQIEAWDKQYPDCNGACVARAVVGEVWFFEVDSKDVLPRMKAETGQDMPVTFMVRSRPGRGHYYFRHNAASVLLGNISQTYVVGQDWSVRTNREYVVAPGSIHPDTGLPYTALNNNPITEAPQWLIDWLLSQKVQKVGTDKAEAPRNERGKVAHGAIHGFMLTQAGRLRNVGLTQDEIEVALLRIVHEQCEEPIDEDKVRAMARSICIYKPGENRVALNQTRFGESGSNFIDIVPAEQRAAVRDEQNKEAGIALDTWLDAPAENPIELTAEQVVGYIHNLTKLGYEQRRNRIADKTGLRISYFDSEHKKASSETKESNEVSDVAALISEIEPWGEEVNLVELLEGTEAVFREYIHFKRPEDSTTAALWVGQTYTTEHQTEFPYLGVRSPVENCGKTSVLDLVAGMSSRTLKAGNLSAAAAFRVLDMFHPCLIIDEADTFIHIQEEFVGILNLGHAKDGGYILRVLGENHDQLTPFAVWGPKAYGMIGTAPATFASRSIPIILERAVKSDGLTQFPKTPKGKESLKLRLHIIGRKWKRWASDNKEAIADWEPNVVEFENRAADNWYPLVRIAEMAGPDWVGKALKAAHVVDPYGKPDMMRLLLRDIQNIFYTRKGKGEGEATTPATLVSDLKAQSTGWDEMGRFDKPISSKKLADMLGDFGVRAHRSNSQRLYRLCDFEEVFVRFLTEPPQETELGSMTQVVGGGSSVKLG
jgi:Protein of unknown function (DUF3631)/Bifunctional DNA primase/polymerase, N-terminal